MSFLTPLFWLGMAALAVPILVHLVRRTRATRIPFPSLMFVRQVPQRTIRKRRLHNLLLLILRCLALLLLVFAFVRPYLSGGGGRGSERNGAGVILLDRSFSMRHGGRFERAREEAQRLIDQGGTKRWGVILFDGDYQILEQLPDPESDQPLDREDWRGRLAAIRPGDGATDYFRALRAAEVMLRPHTGVERSIHLLSDFQRTAWKVRNNGAGLGLPAGIKLIPFNVGEREVANLAVTEVRAVGTIYQPKYTETLTARVTNFGSAPAGEVPVELRLNDQPVERRQVAIPAGGTVSVDFTGFNLTEGLNRVGVRLAGDGFSDDNERVLTLRRLARSRGLVIESAERGGRGAERSPSFFVRNALMAGENSPFELVVRTAGAVNPAELDKYRLVILNDVTVSPVLGGELLRRVAAGTPLIMALGSRTSQEGFNAAFRPTLGVTLGDQSELRGSYVTLSEAQGDHPIFASFRGQADGRQRVGLPAGRVFGYRRIEVTNSPAGASNSLATLARYDDGAPALLEIEAGRGRVMLLTTTLDTSWNDLPLKPSYLPLLRQMTRYLVEQEQPLASTVGETLPVKTTADGILPAIDAPTGRRLPEFQTETPWSGGPAPVLSLAESGFYQLRYPGRTELVAVNTAAPESDLNGIEAAELAAAMTGQPESVTAESGSSAETTEPERPESIESRQRLWFYLLLAALLLFITEGVLAGRIRRARMVD